MVNACVIRETHIIVQLMQVLYDVRQFPVVIRHLVQSVHIFNDAVTTELHHERVNDLALLQSLLVH